MSSELLLELFSEEIPARMQEPAAAYIKEAAKKALDAEALTYTRIESYVTPRRVTLVVEGLPEKQADKTEEKRGPRTNAPDAALNGFLGATGLTKEQLEVRGDFYYAVVESKGRNTKEVLVGLLETIINELPWPKSMRWGANEKAWVRPLKRIICLFNGEVLPVTFGHVTASNLTEGHRFLGSSVFGLGAFEVKNFADYQTKLEAAHVTLDQNKRRADIVAQIEKLAVDKGFTLKPDEKLLTEVTGLVEYPVALLGTIDAAFMDVPGEVLSTSMREHQKYFSLLDKPLQDGGKLAPHFITISNMKATDGGKAIIAGNERVLRARLSDAKFFWEQDQKIPLGDYTQKLDNITFHAKLGSIGDKVRRMGSLSGDLQVASDKLQVQEAIKLCKADLVTGMVGEFPELQGLMGYYYASKAGISTDVAEAIRDHYKPQGPDDSVPSAPLSIAVALADKLDTLVGLFMAGEIPTGSKDPFALRRAALGIIRIILENNLRLNVGAVLEQAASQFSSLAAQKTTALEALHTFIQERLKVQLRAQGYRHDVVDAVFSVANSKGLDILDIQSRVQALAEFLKSDDGANLIAGYKRAMNIVTAEEKKEKASFEGEPDGKALGHPLAESLFSALSQVREPLMKKAGAGDYTAAMQDLATFRAPIDAFFDQVTVNDNNPVTRENRLRLLKLIGRTMNQVADFSKIEG